MAQQTTTVPAKTTGDELTASELNSINNVVNANSADSESRLTSLEGFAVAIIEDQKASGTAGGSSVAGLQQRDLNTIVSDDNSLILSLSSNEFSLNTGEYLIEAVCPNHRTNASTIYLYKNGVELKVGSSGYARSSTEAGSCKCFVNDIVDALDTDVFSVYNYCNSSHSNSGLGVSSGSSTAIYTQIKITKLG